MARRLYDRLYAEAQTKLASILQGEEREIVKLYGTALSETRLRLKRYWHRYGGPDGRITNPETCRRYNRLLRMQDQISEILRSYGKKVDELTERMTGEQYSAAYWRHAYAIDQSGGMALDWGLVPEQAVEAAVRSRWRELVSSRTMRRVAEGTIEKVEKEISLSVVRGDSWDSLALRISNVLGVQLDGRRAIYIRKGAAYRSLLIARTEGQRIMVEGQAAALRKARELGCDMVEYWDAALDGRTRPAHGALDGRPKDDPEKGWLVPEIGWVSAPLHSGVASFDINCRCRIGSYPKGYPPEERWSRGDGVIPYQTYEAWLAERAGGRTARKG